MPPMRTRHLTACGLAALSLAAAGCGGGEEKEADFGSSFRDDVQQTETQEEQPLVGANRSKPKIEIPAGKPPAKLQSEDLIVGKGATAKTGQAVTVNYVGVLHANGKQFDASFDRNEPYTLTLGAGEVIAGWDQGIEGMKVGGRRKLTIPSDLAYGAQGRPPDIKPNATLVFVIDLLGAQ
jgi:peptidylprolyl isomerase